MPEFVVSWSESAVALIALALIALSAFGVGRPVLIWLSLDDEDDPLATIVWSLSLGLVLAALALTALGLIGLLYGMLVCLLTMASATWGMGEAAQFYYHQRDRRPLRRGSEVADSLVASAPSPRSSQALKLGSAVIALATLVSALAPPTAGDALCYHLELPKVFLQRHGIAYLPYNENCTYPLLCEMLYLWGLACAGPVTAQLIAWGQGLLLALASALLATPLLGRPWSWVVGALVLAVPGISNHLTAPLCDVGVSLFVVLALAAWRQLALKREPAWLFLAGLMLGAALSTKHVAWLIVPSLLAHAFWTYCANRAEGARVAFALAIVLAMSAIVASPWYLRSWRHRGDPVYPFLSADIETAIAKSDKTPLSLNPADIALAPWQVTFEPERFGGRGHQLGPLFLMLLPGLAFVRRLRGGGVLVTVCGGYLIAWYALRQNTRFLFPIVPLLTIGVVWGMVELRRMPAWPRRLAWASIAGVLAVGTLLPVYRARQHCAVALGIESRGDYLARTQPVYTATLILNRLCGPQARILSEDYRAFYFEGEVVRDSVYRRRERDLVAAESRVVSVELKERGFTHLVLAEPLAGHRVPHDNTLSRLVDHELARPPGVSRLMRISDYTARDVEGIASRYRVYALR